MYDSCCILQELLLEIQDILTRHAAQLDAIPVTYPPKVKHLLEV